MSERRRLPVLQEPTPPPPPPESEDEERPPWHWVGFGVVAIFAAWLPLAYVGGAMSARVVAARFGKDASKDAIDLALATMTARERAELTGAIALPVLFALAVAAFGGGVVVGRFGTGTGAREAALSGAVVAIIVSAVALSTATPNAILSAVVLAVIAVGFGAWGGRFGASRRPKT
jgi:hypothetical protein